MAFDETTVASVNPEVVRGGQVWVSWVPTTSGLTWQIYFGQQFMWSGVATGVWLPVPPADVRVHIGSVLPSEENTDFGSTLAAPARRASLTWTAGTATAPDLDHFAVFGEKTPGGGVDLTKPLATIAAFPGGDPIASGSYSWTSDALTNGTWHYTVVAYDTAGNAGTAANASVTIAVPPGPPSGLKATLNPNGTTPTVTLAWTASAWD